MTQRTLAGLLAVPLLIGLWVTAALVPLPYVTYEPGLTVNVLGDNDDGQPIIEVEGKKSYPDDGQLRMTTVYVSQPRPEGKNTIFGLVRDWVSDDDAVYPYDAIYRDDETVQQNKEEGQLQMTSSQDAATAVALGELGLDVTELYVSDVTEGTPAEGNLVAGDVILRADGEPVSTPDEVVAAVQASSSGEPVVFVVRRGGERQTVSVTPTAGPDPQVGIQVGTKLVDDLPVDVSINLNENIGGPSAGLMFSLGIYDTLTPGSLTGGETVAGTGTMDVSGAVGPIGGIQQKIAGAREAGAKLFLVPPDNCADAAGASNGDMRLVRAETMHDARLAIEKWVADPDADLPTCTAAS